ncbi:hypothetical protein MA16_Dca018298 [Dendrobium catenatum]|uniref:Uncharacterized protein n=1 Tax=Dendrobium catenatum TaxID=906689 RepID=A0A2I0W1A2_9ASPA|nr:hypothetical protein MA16_Dca018298 [Dendrobium catenatum]
MGLREKKGQCHFHLLKHLDMNAYGILSLKKNSAQLVGVIYPLYLSRQYKDANYLHETADAGRSLRSGSSKWSRKWVYWRLSPSSLYFVCRTDGFNVDVYPLKIQLSESKYKMMWNYFFPEDEQDPQRRQYKFEHKGEISQPAVLISVTLMEYKFLYNFSNTPMMVLAMDFSPPLRDCSVLNVVKPRLLYFELL